MEIALKWHDDTRQLEATNEAGNSISVEGGMAFGATQQQSFRSMQMLLTSLAGCSAIDVLSILKKGRQRVDSFEVKASGVRREGIPSPFEIMRLQFVITGKVKEARLARAIELAESKYCSVRFSLHPDISVEYDYTLHYVD
jgi:putative redox protein